MSMITEQINSLREAADFRHTIGDYMTAGLHREAADTIEAYQKAFEDIRAEIRAIPYQRLFGSVSCYSMLDVILEIIDKHDPSKAGKDGDAE